MTSVRANYTNIYVWSFYHIMAPYYIMKKNYQTSNTRTDGLLLNSQPTNMITISLYNMITFI